MKKLFGLLLIACLFMFTDASANDSPGMDDDVRMEKFNQVSDVGSIASGELINYSYKCSEINLKVDLSDEKISICMYKIHLDRGDIYGNTKGIIANIDFKMFALPNYPYNKGYVNHYNSYMQVVINLV